MPDESSSPQGASDAELLSRVGAREREAFEMLYERYARPAFGLALRRLSDRQDAEDAVQDTFAAIWRSASTYRPDGGAAGGWVYTVAQDAIADRLHRKGSGGGGKPEPTGGREESFVAWRVHRALEDLPARDRELIELAYWSGWSQEELAGYLGLTTGTVETRVGSALARLASLLEGGLN